MPLRSISTVIAERSAHKAEGQKGFASWKVKKKGNNKKRCLYARFFFFGLLAQFFRVFS